MSTTTYTETAERLLANAPLEQLSRSDKPDSRSADMAEEKMGRLERNNAWLKSQMAAAEKVLALRYLPKPLDDDEGSDDPDYWSYAGLVAKYCAALRRESEYIDGRTDLLAALYTKEVYGRGARVTVKEAEAGIALCAADRRIKQLKEEVRRCKADLVCAQARNDELFARVVELSEASAVDNEGSGGATEGCGGGPTGCRRK